MKGGVMTKQQVRGCRLVSGGRDRAAKFWLFTNGQDLFVALSDVVDVWETNTERFGST
jgi:hypothetical protein